ncbi:hypothetical protein LUZ60_012811 [Juncus effusus]|nr:hypothetical protein LUZ60_012811 [Juncus effusus]
MEAPGEIVTSLSQYELQEKIGRLKSMLSNPMTGSLPDKGEKLRLQARQCQEELDRRRRMQAALPEKDGENCDRLSQSKCAESSGSVEDQSAKDSPSSFAKLFSKRFEPKLGVSSVLKNKSKLADKKDNDVSNEKKDKNVSVSNVKKDKDVLLLNEKNEKEKEKSVPPKNGTNISLKNSQTSVSAQKRKRLSEIGDSTRSRSNKDKEVVLLDEETTPAQSKKDETDWVEARACYPSSEDPEMVELSCSDLKCLEPEEYLSSPVMNFYIMYLQRHLSPAGTQRSNCYFFNTYFYNKLEEAFSAKGKKNESFLKLRRWWKGVNIFQKEYIFMPVYGDMHWSLVIICIPPDDDNSGPIVLHLDSLVYHNSITIFDVINKFLKEEWMCMDHNTPNKRRKNLPRKIENKIVKVPQQENDYDCGLFVLYFMERFYEKAPERLRKKDLSMFGIRWFEKCNASGLRKRIKSLLLEVFENSKLEISTSKSKSTSNSENEEDEN